MRNVVLGVGISLDGYIARPDGSIDFLFVPRDFKLLESKTYSKGLIALQHECARQKAKREV